MKRKDLLIAGSIIGIIIVLIGIGIVISPNSTNDNNSISLYGLNSTDANSTADDIFFDNYTSEATAISIARLNDGSICFDPDIVANASLTSDGKYWIVKLHSLTDSNDNWVVIVDAKT